MTEKKEMGNNDTAKTRGHYEIAVHPQDSNLSKSAEFVCGMWGDIMSVKMRKTKKLVN